MKVMVIIYRTLLKMKTKTKKKKKKNPFFHMHLLTPSSILNIPLNIKPDI
jgi:hypothetical protein